MNNKLCCIYAYYEKNNSYKSNLDYFLKNAILDNIDYYVVINGNSTINIPSKSNIIIYKRPNIGFDFGAYSYAVSKINKIYDYYFFLNTSVCGPYLRNNDKPWTSYFLDLFNKNLKTKLVGTTINILPLKMKGSHNFEKLYGNKSVYSHVQSMFFCIDNECLNYLKKINFFYESECNNYTNIVDIICLKEIGLSQLILNNDWNINCILDKYKDLDYRILNYNINPTAPDGDTYYKNRYFGNTINKYDVIFLKNNRINETVNESVNKSVNEKININDKKYNLPNDFNINNYKLLNKDLSNMNEQQLKDHYIKFGIKEGRPYKITLPNDFNPNNYKLIYKDLQNMNDQQLKYHYIKYGIKEGRKYKL